MFNCLRFSKIVFRNFHLSNIYIIVLIIRMGLLLPLGSMDWLMVCPLRGGGEVQKNRELCFHSKTILLVLFLIFTNIVYFFFISIRWGLRSPNRYINQIRRLLWAVRVRSNWLPSWRLCL